MAQSFTEDFEPLSPREEWLAVQVTDIAYWIHRRLGPGLLESVYEACFCHELAKRKIPYHRQKPLSIRYDDELVLEAGLRLDLLIDEKVIVELKAQELSHDVWEAQVLSYLKLTGLRLGYVINFNVPLIKKGIKRKII